MSHLRFIEIENFKSFGAPFKFEFAPITILTGTNSSGKSNLIKALSLLSNSQKENYFFQKLNFLKDRRLGGFKTSLNNNKKKEEYLIQFKVPIEIDYFDGEYVLHLAYEEAENEVSNNGILSNLEIKESNLKQTPFFSVTTKIIHRDLVNGEILEESEIDEEGLEFGFIEKSHEQFVKCGINTIIKSLKDAFQNYNNNKSEKNLHENLLLEFLNKKRNFIDQIQNDIKIRKNEIVYEDFYETKKYRELILKRDNPKEINSILQDYTRINESKLIFEYFSLHNGTHLKLTDNKNPNVVKLRLIEDAVLTKIIHYKNDLDSWDYLYNTKPSFFTSEFAKTLVSNIIKKLIDDTLDEKLEEFSEKIYRSDLLTPFGEVIINKCFIENIETSFKRLRNTFNISYLGSTRGFQSHVTSVYDLSAESIISLYEVYLTTRKAPLQETDYFINFWVKQFGIGDSISLGDPTISGLVKALIINKKNEEINIADLGYGTTQLLPIIIQIALNGAKNLNPITLAYSPSIICIEEPEANLHPSLQSKLADMFIDAAHKFNIQFILETHSEYIIRKMQYWVADGSISADAINLYYFNEPGKTETYINKINITDEGSLTEDFGPGFFDEADKIALDLFLLNKAQKN